VPVSLLPKSGGQLLASHAQKYAFAVLGEHSRRFALKGQTTCYRQIVSAIATIIAYIQKQKRPASLQALICGAETGVELTKKTLNLMIIFLKSKGFYL